MNAEIFECFFAYTSTAEIAAIKELLRKKKSRIALGDYTNAYIELEQSKRLFEDIVLYAKEVNDEQLANLCYIMKTYLSLFCNLAQYFQLLDEAQYKKSWDILQNCFDVAIAFGQFVGVEKRYDVPDIVALLLSYEELYPYNVFSSIEMLITKSHCSICGKSMLSLGCSHIKGKLYWGEIACEVVDHAKLQAVAMVSHPLDKRCVMEISGDTRTEEEKFAVLHDLVQRLPNHLIRFEVEKQKSTRMRDDIKIVGRNKPCSCGSGKKFKKCCLDRIYFQHTHLLIHQKQPLELYLFS